ncbi:hypothetical protein T492DRAFT_1015500 [Pavlovales sp. CCMP2436]|nr:hypothetical protein T492DRAFT_1015500 [Pavlovales sp. CCMP2436]
MPILSAYNADKHTTTHTLPMLSARLVHIRHTHNLRLIASGIMCQVETCPGTDACLNM